MTFWILWSLATGATWGAWRALSKQQPTRPWRIVEGLVLAFVALAPLTRALLRVGVAWLYHQGPAWLADWAMTSRQHLPPSHYQALAEHRLLALLLVAAALGWGLVLAHKATRPAARARWATWWQRREVRATLGALLALTVAFVGFNLWLDHAFRRPHPVFYTDCHKVWGHRGHPEPPQIPENTIASYQRAFDLGAPGVEMDVRYDAQRHEFFIGRYDRGAEPPPGQRLTLEEVFRAVGKRGYFWLDTKTIHYMTPAEAQQAARDLAALLDRFDLRERAIVESDTPENLRYFAQAGLHTSYWIFNIDEEVFPKTPWGLWWALARIKLHYIQGNFSAISLDRRFYTPFVAFMLRGARIHLFTVDNPKALKALVRRPEVRVILTNTDLYSITDCPPP